MEDKICEVCGRNIAPYEEYYCINHAIYICCGCWLEMEEEEVLG